MCFIFVCKVKDYRQSLSSPFLGIFNDFLTGFTGRFYEKAAFPKGSITIFGQKKVGLCPLSLELGRDS